MEFEVLSEKEFGQHDLTVHFPYDKLKYSFVSYYLEIYYQMYSFRKFNHLC